jgi:hypothetical protein
MSILSASDPAMWSLAAAAYEDDADRTLPDGGPCTGPASTHFNNWGEVVFYCYLMHAAASAGDL